MPVTATLPEAAALAISDGGDVFDITAQLARDGNPWPFIEWQWGQVLFAEDVMADPELPERLKADGERFLIIDRFQFELISAVFDPTIREVYVKGNTGCGKGMSSAIAICVYYSIYHDARVVITRDSNDTAVTVAYGEVRAWWLRMADPPKNIEVQAEGLIDSTNRQHVLFVANPRSSEGFSGVHGPHILYWFDEATAEVLGPRFALADTQATKFLATANPRTVSGPFFRAFQLASDPDKTQTVRGPYGLRRLITADGEDMLNVRLQRLEHAVSPHGGITIEGTFYEAGEPIPRDVFEKVKRIVPGQTGYDVHQGHKQNPDPNWVLCFAHGKFPPEDAELQVVLRSWLVQPVEEWKEWRAIVARAEKHQGSAALKLAREYCPIQALGLDVGASRKGDASILTLGGERGIAAQHEYKTTDAADLVAWIFRTVERYGVNLAAGGIPIGIDAVGVGWGVTGLLRERGVLVVEIKGNDTSDDPKRYVNKRAEMYGEFGARVNPDGEYADQPFLLPDDEMLLAELVAPQKIFTTSGEGMAYKITPKRKVPGLTLKVETIEEKLGRSPDRGDSACYWWRAMQVRGVDLSEWLDAGAF